MRNIKNFESFSEELNELSTELVNKAAEASAAKDFTGDDIGNTKNIRQGNKFLAYINPGFKAKLKNMGFGAKKTDTNSITLTMKINDLGTINIFVGSDTYKMDVKAAQLNNSLLAKVNRAIKLTQQELKSSNEL